MDVSASLASACAAIDHRLSERGIAHALIGGLALGAHRVIRTTEDVDFLIDAAREPDVHQFMADLGFETLRRTDDVSNYLLKHQRVDFIHARRKYSQEMLKRASPVSLMNLTLPVATVEDVIALKLQERHSDPKREQDTPDIHRLVEYNIETLDLEYLREFFKLFKCEAELDDLLRRFGRSSR
jgi:predicted nucleotidyltransferase